MHCNRCNIVKLQCSRRVWIYTQVVLFGCEFWKRFFFLSHKILHITELHFIYASKMHLYSPSLSSITEFLKAMTLKMLEPLLFLLPRLSDAHFPHFFYLFYQIHLRRLLFCRKSLTLMKT